MFFDHVNWEFSRNLLRGLTTLDHRVSDDHSLAVQTQTTTAYCGILPTLDHHI